MVMIPSALLTEIVEVEPLEGNASMGPVYGEPVIEKVRFDGRRRRVSGPDGKEIIGSGTILARPDSVMTIGAKVTRRGRVYTVVEILPIQGLSRVHHLEVLVS